VDKLLTGFDAPRNTVLYILRRLKEYGLLRAIARVSRVSEEEGVPDKPFGIIIDYTGALKNLGAALASYNALEGFSDEDIARSVVAIRDEANKVPGTMRRSWRWSSRSQTFLTRKPMRASSLAKR
jgi:type I restriction enzyme, R subunit